MPTHHPRVNMIVTEEHFALLSEITRLDPTVRSPPGYMRQVLDEMTPLLRVTVAAMQAAAQELDQSRAQLRKPLADLLAAMEQHDLLDHASAPRRRREPPAAKARTDAPPKRARRARQPGSSDPQGQ